MTGFSVVRVPNGWRIRDEERGECLGRLFHFRTYADAYLDTLRGQRPEIVRFILTGKTKP